MPIDVKNKVLIDTFEDKLKVKRSTARVYASQLVTLARNMKIPFDLKDLVWLKKAKVLRHVGNVNNLTRRKNTASAIIAGLKVVGEKKVIEEYREILMQADKDHTAFLVSGKRKRPYVDADRQWTMIRSLWKKVSAIVSAQKLWQRGDSINITQYRTLMQLVYLKFLSDMPVRRLEYAATRYVARGAEAASGNYIVPRPKGPWRWRLSNYKTFKNFGTQEYKVSTGLKKLLRQLEPITKAKNNDGYIFLNSRWQPMSRDLFSKFVARVFQTYAGKKWTQNTIRSIKVSSVWKDSVKTVEALKLAESMGHDPRTAMIHYREK